jgi:hypothetical protein
MGPEEEDVLGAIMGGAGAEGGAPPGGLPGALPPEEMPMEEGALPPEEAQEERPDPVQVLGDLESIVAKMKLALS